MRPKSQGELKLETLIPNWIKILIFYACLLIGSSTCNNNIWIRKAIKIGSDQIFALVN
jgi:hypothetical protein